MFQASDKDNKLEKIKQIGFKHLNQPKGPSYKLSEQCPDIPTTLISQNGYHRDCFQCFT